jgi:hypothetical protein
MAPGAMAVAAAMIMIFFMICAVFVVLLRVMRTIMISTGMMMRHGWLRCGTRSFA